MRSSSFASHSLSLAAAAAVLVLGCNATVTIKPQTKFVGSSAVAKTATRDLTAADAIEIENANGDVVVNGDPTATKVSVSTKVAAFADNQADGDAAIADVTATIAIDESTGKFLIHCSTAQSTHGSAATGTTACEGFTVTVPAGSATAPLALKATAHNGQIDATGLSGSATIHSDNGDATASVTPGVGSSIEVSTANGDASLALPAAFTADTVTLTPGGTGANVTTTDFPDVLQATSANRKAGGAKSITVSTELGDVTLKKQ
jgi:hypothetical protein